jgi:hypothetical protein
VGRPAAVRESLGARKAQAGEMVALLRIIGAEETKQTALLLQLLAPMHLAAATRQP